MLRPWPAEYVRRYRPAPRRTQRLPRGGPAAARVWDWALSTTPNPAVAAHTRTPLVSCECIFREKSRPSTTSTAGARPRRCLEQREHLRKLYGLRIELYLLGGKLPLEPRRIPAAAIDVACTMDGHATSQLRDDRWSMPSVPSLWARADNEKTMMNGSPPDGPPRRHEVEQDQEPRPDRRLRSSRTPNQHIAHAKQTGPIS